MQTLNSAQCRLVGQATNLVAQSPPSAHDQSMRLRQIEIFYHVYRTGTISGAARDLNVSQPSVSKVLRHAEDQLGVDLFLRRKGRLVPTQAAHELYLDAEDIHHRLSAFNRSLENIRSRRGGHIRLGVLPSLSLSVAPELVARMRQENHELSFELTTLHSSEIAQSLFERRSDLCIGFEAIDDGRVRCHEVGQSAFALVSGKSLDQPEARVSASILAGRNYIGTRDSGPLGDIITGELDARGVHPIEVATAHTYHVALSLVRKRVGLAITDQYTAYSHLGSGLHRYRLDDLPQFPVYAATLSDHPEPELAAEAVRVLREIVVDFTDSIAAMQPPNI